MVGWMSFFDSHKKAATGCTNLPCCLHGQLNTNTIIKHFGGFCDDGQCLAEWSWTTKLDVVLRRHCARRFSQFLLVHQGDGSGPIPMAIKERPNDATVDHARKGLMMVFGIKFHLQSPFNAMRVYFQTVVVGWAATKTNRSGRIGLLNAEFPHGDQHIHPIDGSYLAGKTERS